MIHYIVQWFDEQSRRMELRTAIERQTALVESVAFIISRKHRPTFAELITRQIDDGQTVNLLTNTDCYVDPEDVPLLERVEPDEVWCISRTDNCCAASQDAWAWRGRLTIRGGDYPQGLPGADNKFAYDCAVAGRVPVNPALSIRVHHLHQSNVRSWTEADRLRLPYLFCEPVRIGEQSGLQCRGGIADQMRLAWLADRMRDLDV